ncbi:MAG: hypothetical protein EXS33_03775 [Pedosphaera sp.]|nr:hypothetical protein [Pedosphaera sp.]
MSHPISYFEDDGLQFFGLRNEPLQNPLNRFFKRIIDIAVALPVVLSLLPILRIIVWFFQRLQSPGPCFYTQPRAFAADDDARLRIFQEPRGLD